MKPAPTIKLTTACKQPETLATFLQAGFEQDLYASAFQNLADLNNKLRFNNFAYAIRELMRHVLNRLAPTESVIKCSWYRDETKEANRPTRRQRAYYAVQGGLSDEYVKNALGIETATIHRALVKAIDNLSKFTHIEPAVFGLSEAEVTAQSQNTKEAMEALCSTIQGCRQQIIKALWEQIDEKVIDEALRETLLAIDEIATHHSIEEVYTHLIEIENITHDEIIFKATGSIAAELQWGSDSDVSRDDGVVMEKSFPFSCWFSSPVDEPAAIEAREDGLLVDTGTWWEGYYDEDD